MNIRHDVCDYMETHPELFAGFFPDYSNEPGVYPTLKEHIVRMRRKGEYG